MEINKHYKPEDIKAIRAGFDQKTITVYQAFNKAIADAVENQTFVSPPFKIDRMTWKISKLSFTFIDKMLTIKVNTTH